MPRIPMKSLLLLGGLVAAGGAAWRSRRAGRPAIPAPDASGPVSAASSVPAENRPEPVRATPPADAPGPSVTPPGRGEGSTTERAEAAEAATPDAEILAGRAGGPVDELVEREVAAAASEAGRIGGPHADDEPDDPAMAPVYEAGGGEAEGFEAAERDLVENASHGTHGRDPSGDAFTPEVESDRSTAVSGDADHETVSEVTEDVPEPETENEPRAEAGGDEPAKGPGVTHER